MSDHPGDTAPDERSARSAPDEQHAGSAPGEQPAKSAPDERSPATGPVPATAPATAPTFGAPPASWPPPGAGPVVLGAYPQGGFVPPRRSRRWTGLWIAGVAVLAMAMGLALAAVLVIPHLFTDAFDESPATLLRAAAAPLETAPAVRYTGGVVGLDGELTTIDLAVTKDGEVLGEVDRPAGGHAEILADDEDIYVRGDREWWLAVEPALAVLADKWAIGGSDTLGFDPRDMLVPHALADLLRYRPATDRPGYPEKTLHGTRAAAVPTTARDTVYVTAEKPYRVLGVDGVLPDLADLPDGVDKARQSAARQFSLDLSVEDDKAAAALDRRLTTARTEVDAAIDPQDPVQLPATYDLVSSIDSDCDVDRCTIIATVTNLGGQPAGPGYLMGRIVADTPTGRELGTCRAPLSAIKHGQKVKVRCTTTSAAWRNWGGGSYWLSAIPFSGGWQGTDPALMGNLLRHVVTVDKNATMPESAEGLRTLLTLLGDSRWKDADALRIANELVEHRFIGSWYQLLASGAKFQYDPAEVIREMDRLDTAATSVGLRREALADAAKLVRDGGGPVAVGAWRAPDEVMYHANLFDLKDKRAVQYVTPVDWKPQSLDEDLTAAARYLTTGSTSQGSTAPPGFRREIVLYLSPASPLYRLDRAALPAALSDAGVQKRDLFDIDQLTVLGGSGRQVLKVSDLPH